MGDPEAPAERLGHRVGERKAGAGHRRAGVHGALEELLPRGAILWVCEHPQ
jgi:hypothetical protein